jgi:hypothetical protein
MHLVRPENSKPVRESNYLLCNVCAATCRMARKLESIGEGVVF